MEAILKGILSSNHPDKMKKHLIAMIAKKGSQPQQVASIKAVLQTAIEWILESKSSVAVEGGLEVYKTWGKSNLSTFEDFFTKDYLLELLQKQVNNEENVILVIHESLNLLQMSLKFQHYVQLFQAKCISYTREHPNILCLTNLVKFLKEFQSCTPSGEFTSTFCVSLIQSLSLCPVPSHDMDVVDFVKKVEVVCALINMIWNKSDSGVVQDSLRAIFEIICQMEGSDLEPSICLGGLVQYIPLAMIDMIVQSTISNKSILNPQMTAVLQRIIDWIHWPTAKSIDKWIIAFLKALAIEKRYAVLIKVTETKVDKVFEKICIPLMRDGAINVATQMLLSFQHSPEPFHKVIPHVPMVIKALKQDETASDKLVSIVEVLYCCMHLHAGYPDLYDPVLEIIKGIPSPTEETIKKKLSENKWTAQRSGVTNFTTKVKQKSVTGKTGLFNLGNTCYMNSILQALYMCDGFRRAVMSHPVSPDEKIMLKLQYTFAFLTLTQRPAYAPVNFLSVSRPPWFTAGHQQDCSEFLKYLFDQLHEQEYETHKKSILSVPCDESKSKNGKIDCGEDTKDSECVKDFPSSDSFCSLIRQFYSGCCRTTYRCCKCFHESSRSEHFIDIPLAFPEKVDNTISQKLSENNAEGDLNTKSLKEHASQPLHLNDLLQHYLKPELLLGDNQYYCDSCGGLQDGERRIQITAAPEYLILTLLRFSYDIKTHSRSKICDDVKYPKTLVLPVGEESSSIGGDKRRSLRSAVTHHINNCGVNTRTSRGEVYGLSGVVVHSGTSSECGHYYTYARHSVFHDPNATRDTIDNCKTEDDLDFLQEKWYLFNDCRVSYANYKSFCDVTQRFSRDTAYKLFYKRINQEDSVSGEQDLNKSLQSADIDPPLRNDLRIAVSKDNAMFLQEQENAELRKNRKRPGPSSSVWNNRFNPDDNDEPPGSCGGGSGFGGLDGPKFVF